jgi:hypothetical protein
VVRKASTATPAQSRTLTRKHAPIAEPLLPVSSKTVVAGDRTIKVPTLTLSGEWLKAAGFPIGSNAYLTTDGRGEIALHRLGLGVPRRLRIRAAK